MTRFVFDLDAVLCTDTAGDYTKARRVEHRVARLRELYDAGAYIVIDSARGSLTGIDWLDITRSQLERWGVPYHELHVGRKPYADGYVDDRALSDTEFFGDAIVDRWPDSYFDLRHGNDPRRIASFVAERRFLERHGVDFGGRVCDVGCSTGELLDALNWTGPRHGMEVSAVARKAAMQRGVDFTQTILTERAYFDTVIFRGTIQHLPEPFRAISQAYRALRSGGQIVFLATPNAGSLVYRLWGRLPVSDDARNFWMPSAWTLANVLINCGFRLHAVGYPYLGAGYARPLRDAWSFCRALVGGPVNFPFPHNMMNLMAVKP